MEDDRLDNTEYMRNGDYSPTRLEAQNDAVQLITNAKLQANVENAVSIMTMGGPSYILICFHLSINNYFSPKVMVTLTPEQGKLMASISSVTIEGGQLVNLKAALQVAQLVLKHRQNPNQRQRIVAFVGSPLGEQLGLEEAEHLNKVLRKNGVALDVISLGPVTENDQILETLVKQEESATTDDESQSHLVRAFQGQGSVVETVASSPIIRRGGEQGSGAGDFAFGVDPEMDPELAMALKLSMEEEMARQAKANTNGSDEEKKTEEAQEQPVKMEGVDEDEDALLQQAIALSMQQQSSNNDNQKN